MNLLEILKRDLKSWPPGGYIAHQSGDGSVFFINGLGEFENGGWSYPAGLFCIDGPRFDRARDHMWARVHQFQWEAA